MLCGRNGIAFTNKSLSAWNIRKELYDCKCDSKEKGQQSSIQNSWRLLERKAGNSEPPISLRKARRIFSSSKHANVGHVRGSICDKSSPTRGNSQCSSRSLMSCGSSGHATVPSKENAQSVSSRRPVKPSTLRLRDAWALPSSVMRIDCKDGCWEAITWSTYHWIWFTGA